MYQNAFELLLGQGFKCLTATRAVAAHPCRCVCGQHMSTLHAVPLAASRMALGQIERDFLLSWNFQPSARYRVFADALTLNCTLKL